MSRYDSRYHNRRLPKQSRRLPLEGSSERGNGLDAGRYYRCWNCGQICNVDRDSLGDSDSRSGVTVQDYIPTPDLGVEGSGVSVMGGFDSSIVALEVGANGEAKGIRSSHEPVVSGGCPFCGTKNWRGDY